MFNRGCNSSVLMSRLDGSPATLARHNVLAVQKTSCLPTHTLPPLLASPATCLCRANRWPLAQRSERQKRSTIAGLVCGPASARRRRLRYQIHLPGRSYQCSSLPCDQRELSNCTESPHRRKIEALTEPQHFGFLSNLICGAEGSILRTQVEPVLRPCDIQAIIFRILVGIDLCRCRLIRLFRIGSRSMREHHQQT